MLQTLIDIKTFLDANLETALTEVETDLSITIERWKYMDRYVSLGRQFPAIHILASSSGETIESAGNRLHMGNPNKRPDVINIVVWAKGNQHDTMKIENTILGYMEALERLFMADDATLESKYKNIKILSTEYTELFPDLTDPDPTRQMKGASFVIEINKRILY